MLLARIGNGTWDETSELVRFHIVFPPDNDLEVRVRINDEDGYWSHPRAARPIAEGATLEPDDLLVELLPLPNETPQRFILGEFDGVHWNLEVH